MKKITHTLTARERKQVIALGSQWEIDSKEKKLVATFPCRSFLDGLLFATRISVHAEVMNHHPELCISSTNLKVTLTTKAAHGVTQADIDLASRINRLLSTAQS